MASPLPLFLVTQVRIAFRQCAQSHNNTSYRFFSLCSAKQIQPSPYRFAQRTRKESVPHPQRNKSTSNDKQENGKIVPAADSTSTPQEQAQSSRELVPRGKDGRAVGTGRTVDAPMKVIPKADITPNLRLTPKERLHIEILTRRPPPVIKQIKPYKERLLIYHHGNASENALIFLKVLGLVCAGMVSLVVVPAHYAAGSPAWLCGSLLIGGWIPSILFHSLLKPLVTRIHLRLPPNARASPDAAMKYAKSLPASAQLDMSFTRITALPGTVTVNVADLQPIVEKSYRPWRFANLKWIGNSVDRGSRLRPNPTEFSVKPAVGPGRARRDVIPDIWPNVYDRLVGEAKESISKWKR